MQCSFPPQYVLDEMEWFEINSVLKYKYYATKDQWEQTRILYSIIYNTNAKHPKQVSEMWRFPWEEETTKENTAISKADIERLDKMAQAYIKENTKKNG